MGKIVRVGRPLPRSMTGSCETVTGKRREPDLLISSHDASLPDRLNLAQGASDTRYAAIDVHLKRSDA
jgi:hypothetical protein